MVRLQRWLLRKQISFLICRLNKFKLESLSTVSEPHCAFCLKTKKGHGLLKKIF